MNSSDETRCHRPRPVDRWNQRLHLRKRCPYLRDFLAYFRLESEIIRENYDLAFNLTYVLKLYFQEKLHRFILNRISINFIPIKNMFILYVPQMVISNHVLCYQLIISKLRTPFHALLSYRTGGSSSSMPRTLLWQGCVH